MPHKALFICKCWFWATWFARLALPYILAVVATGKQHLATIAAVAEAGVNIVLSIWLVQRIGAVGVALGTLVGAFVSLGVHLFVSMRYTQPTILIPRTRFVLQGVLAPLLIIVPSLFLYPFWRKLEMLPAPPAVLAIWIAATAAIAWWVTLTAEDRRELGAVPRTAVILASRADLAAIEPARSSLMRCQSSFPFTQVDTSGRRSVQLRAFPKPIGFLVDRNIERESGVGETVFADSV